MVNLKIGKSWMKCDRNPAQWDDILITKEGITESRRESWSMNLLRGLLHVKIFSLLTIAG
jgi:hypothetical protein